MSGAFGYGVAAQPPGPLGDPGPPRLDLFTDAMLLENGAAIDLTAYASPGIRTGLAFFLSATLDACVTDRSVFAAIAGVAPAMEITDLDLADGGGEGSIVIGDWSDGPQNLGNRGMILEMDGDAVLFTSTAAILPCPVQALAAAARLAISIEKPMAAGSLAFLRTAIAASPIAIARAVCLSVQDFGRAALKRGE